MAASTAAAEKSSIKGTPSCRYSLDNNNLLEDGDADEEDADDSDGELEKCLYGTRSNGKSQERRAHRDESNRTAMDKDNLISNKISSASQEQHNRSNGLVNSSSTSSLASSISMSNGLNLCDSLKLRSSRSCWQLGGPAAGVADEVTADLAKGTFSNLDKTQTKYCEKCEILDSELTELRQKYIELEGALDDANEKNFVLEKLNRSIEIENENFAYKVRAEL